VAGPRDMPERSDNPASEAMYALIREVRDIVIRMDGQLQGQAERRGQMKLLRWAFPSGAAVVVAMGGLAVWAVARH